METVGIAFWYENLVAWFADNRQNVMRMGFAVLIIIATGSGYFYYVDQREKEAHKAYHSLMKYVDATVAEEKAAASFDTISFKTSGEKWKRVLALADDALMQHSGSEFLSLFWGRKAESLLSLGEKERALQAFKQASATARSRNVGNFHELAAGLIELDSKDEATRQQGQKRLEAIAAYDGSPAHDVTLYRLGQYYWSTQNYTEAKSVWGRLIMDRDAAPSAWFTPDEEESPWVKKARQKMAMIDYR